MELPRPAKLAKTSLSKSVMSRSTAQHLCGFDHLSLPPLLLLPHSVVADYYRLLAEDPDITKPVAAIERPRTAQA